MSRRVRPDVPAAPGIRPIVAIVGRPNVGKSTLFNRLAGAKIAIVEDHPGVTRDRNYADADFFGREVTLVDTGGFDPEPGDVVTDLTRSQVELAIDEADVLLCVFDGRAELTSADHETVRLLRCSDKPVVFAANKVDGDKHEAEAMAVYQVGIEELSLISALHGRGISELIDRVVEVLPEPEEVDEPEAPEGSIRVAIVGRPNAGKSSLVNRLLGKERMLTDSEPGTTRDPIDSLVVRDGRGYVLIDTAGIRRRSRVAAASERHAVFAAIRSLERAHVAIVLVDAVGGAAEQDAKIAGLAVDRGCALVLAANKWDLIKGEDAAKTAAARVGETLAFVPWAPFVRISAKSGRGVKRLLGTIDRVFAEHDKRVGTGELNRFFETLVERKPPPMMRGRPVKFYYVTQSTVRPPRFVVSCNYPEAVHFSYQRFVANRIREKYGFEGTPIRVLFKKRGRKKKP